MTEWIPVIGMAITLAIALLKHYGKVRHAKALEIVVQAINKGDAVGMIKDIVKEDSMELPEGKIIDAIVQKYKATD